MTHKKPMGGASAVITKYQKHISGPILDPIDIHIEVSRVDYEKLSGNKVSCYKLTINTRGPVGLSLPPCGSIVTPTPMKFPIGTGDWRVTVVYP